MTKRRALFSFAHLGGIDCGLFRIRGVGLANCLFPWARCVVASEKYTLSRIASTWPQICHRQWMRWDRDKRLYSGLFDESREAITGLNKIRGIYAGKRISERDFISRPDEFGSGVVIFSGMDGFFSDILHDHDYVKDVLVRSAVPKHRAFLKASFSRSICVHVRLGDFKSDPSAPNARRPLCWYVHVIRELRAALGDVDVDLFSDGSDEELRELLALPRSRRVFYGSSIADLFAMSQGRVLVASASTFSSWAAYLGRMPVIWPLHGRVQKLHREHWQFEPEVGFEPLPIDVVSLIRRQFERTCETASAAYQA
jgi:Glycosyl transferase family 11